MKKLYDKTEMGFALLWIVIYCLGIGYLRGARGDDSFVMLLGLLAVTVGIAAFVKKHGLEEKYGLVKWRGGAADYLYFLPMLILSTGNLWDGVGVAYPLIGQVMAVLSMLLVGFVEELIFRGFLFRALLKENPPRVAIAVSAVTFGIGHIVNLLIGQGGLETLVQVVFAIAGGLMFTEVFYRSGSLWVCILAHGLVDVFAEFSAAESGSAYLYPVVSILVSAAYCFYLSRKPAALEQKTGEDADDAK